MRPRPLFQSLPVFTCFDRGLRFFVSKLCPNVRCLPSRAWIRQQSHSSSQARRIRPLLRMMAMALSMVFMGPLSHGATRRSRNLLPSVL